MHYHVHFGQIGCTPDDSAVVDTRRAAEQTAAEWAAGIRESGRWTRGAARSGYVECQEINYIEWYPCADAGCYEEYADVWQPSDGPADYNP
jgi:hypothetical protein